jgi:hypothetical protein
LVVSTALTPARQLKTDPFKMLASVEVGRKRVLNVEGRMQLSQASPGRGVADQRDCSDGGDLENTVKAAFGRRWSAGVSASRRWVDRE